MTNEKQYKFSLNIARDELIQFSDLAHRIAITLHPDEDMEYAAARVNLDTELEQAVRDGILKVRNRYGLGHHSFPFGNALQESVLIPDIDLEPFLKQRGIALTISSFQNESEAPPLPKKDKYVLKQELQRKRIIALLVEAGFRPSSLGQRIQGKSTPKKIIKLLALKEPGLFTGSSFDKAWQQLRDSGEIKDST